MFQPCQVDGVWRPWGYVCLIPPGEEAAPPRRKVKVLDSESEDVISDNDSDSDVSVRISSIFQRIVIPSFPNPDYSVSLIYRPVPRYLFPVEFVCLGFNCSSIL